jgi:hypothetical protein
MKIVENKIFKNNSEILEIIGNNETIAIIGIKNRNI